jgi:hypothetical protein
MKTFLEVVEGTVAIVAVLLMIGLVVLGVSRLGRTDDNYQTKHMMEVL